MNLRDIEYFAAVAEYRSVRRASEALNLSPPALSKSLRRLEAAMGAKLVRPTSKGVELTVVGAALLTHVARIRVTLDDVAREAADLSLGRAGHIRIGAGPTVCDELTNVYGPLIADSTRITMQVVVSDNDVTLPMLMKGELDLIFNHIPPAMEPSLEQEQLFFDSWIVCASESHRLVGKKNLRIDDLAEERWALSAPRILSQQWLTQAFLERGLAPPKIAVEARSLSMRLRTWATSDLLGFCPRRVLNDSSNALRLRELPINELTWRRPVGVLTRKEAYLSPAARRFLELLRAYASKVAK